MRTSGLILSFGLLIAFFAGCEGGGDGNSTPQAPTISTQPSNQTVTLGQTARFTVTSTGTAPITYQWQVSTDSGTTWDNVSTGSGGATARYTTSAMVVSDSGNQYRCVVVNTGGSATSDVAGLTVTVPTGINITVGSGVVSPGKSITVPVIVSGMGASTARAYQVEVSFNQAVLTSGTMTKGPGTPAEWVFTCNNATVYPGRIISISFEFGSGSAVVDGVIAYLTFTVPAGAAGGEYFVTLYTVYLFDQDNNEIITTNNNGTIAVLTAEVGAPTITTQPMSALVVAGAPATFTAAVVGNPAPTYQWQISTDSGSTWNDVSTGSGGTTSSYTTPATVVGDSGSQYRCLAANALGNATSDAATLTVDVRPSITAQPTDVTVTAPAPGTFTIIANGQASLSYQWQASTDFGHTWTDVSTGTGGTMANYMTAATVVGDNGKQFRCVVTNGVGIATSNAAKLTVYGMPTITVQPVSGTAMPGGVAAFLVRAAGNPAISYQWLQSTDGGSTWNDIPGATAEDYITPATAAGDNGIQFHCVVTNALGTATSDEAMLTVTTALPGEYVLIDLSGGTQALSYPYTVRPDPPPDLLTDTSGPGGNSIYKTTHLVLRRIPAGTFTMGSPVGEVGHRTDETQHQVTLTKGFYMGVFEVTQEQYRLVTGLSPSYFSGNPANPVEQVSWKDVRGSDWNWPGGTHRPDGNMFLGVISTKTGLAFDLPTEAQWEYACRAGTTTALNSGQDLTSGTQDAAADAVAWDGYNSGAKPHAVGGKLPTPGDCMTCMGTSRSGALTCSIVTPLVLFQIQRVVLPLSCACCAAAVGSTLPRASVPRIATCIIRTTTRGPTTTASGSSSPQDSEAHFSPKDHRTRWSTSGRLQLSVAQ
jgi:hypothetical protein